ncbi:MAG: hypothetical protein HY677_02455 [Chloroflexi bacterium]|nr:hypothetical protein [Chloroflexota bacterium]
MTKTEVLGGSVVERYQTMVVLAEGQREALLRDDVAEFERLAQCRQELLEMPVEIGQWKDSRARIGALVNEVQDIDRDNIAALGLRMALAKKQLDDIRSGRFTLRRYRPGFDNHGFFDRGA